MANGLISDTLVRMSAWTDEPLDEREFPDDEDLIDAEDEAPGSITPCPHCGCGMYEDAPQCPKCRQWVSDATGQWRRSGKWYVRGGLWLTRTLLLNWLFWIGSTALAALAWWLGRR